MIGEVISLQALRELSRLTGSGSECEGVANGQHREVNIHFGGVDGLTTVVAVHLLGGHS